MGYRRDILTLLEGVRVNCHEHQSSLVVPRTVWVTGDRKHQIPKYLSLESIHDIGVKSAYSNQEIVAVYSWARMQHS